MAIKNQYILLLLKDHSNLYSIIFVTFFIYVYIGQLIIDNRSIFGWQHGAKQVYGVFLVLI